MRLAAGNGTYLIHGTNNPIAVGLAVTHGCIRMYPDDVAELFPLVPVGTTVRLINEPVKVAWVDGELLLEAHPPVDAQGQSFEPDLDEFSRMLQAKVGDSTLAIHWDYAREVLQKADGVIATVGLEADLSALDGPAPATGAAPAAGSEPAPSTAPAAKSEPASSTAPTAKSEPASGSDPAPAGTAPTSGSDPVPDPVPRTAGDPASGSPPPQR
jgi:L,D-transpeptidase ErfK/SrfK